MYQPAGSLSVFYDPGQMGTALTAWLAFEYEWKYVYYFMMGILLLSILILFITMPNHGFAGRFPINFRKFGNVTAFCISLTCITYVLVYGKVLDWYDDPSICWATAISILFAGIFLYMDVTRRSSYFILGALRLRTIRMGALLYLLLMIINSSAMFVNVYAGVGMHLDNLQNASLANWCMVGYFIGALISIVLGSKGVHLKYLFALGFFFLALSAGFMYFEVQTAGLYRTNEVSRNYWYHRNDDFICIDGSICQSADAFQISFDLDLHHAYRPYGTGTGYRRGYLFKCTAGAPATLYYPLCTKC